MLVGDVMQTRLVTVAPDTPLSQAMALLGRRGIRHLPVVDGDRLVGIVSDRDLKRAAAPPPAGPEDRPVSAIMTRQVLTIAPSFPVEEAARVMVAEKISALPVTEAGSLVGIVTETDVLDLFVRALGAGEPSSRLDVELGERESALAEVVAAVERAGARIASIVTLTNRRGLREAIIRVRTINPVPAVEGLRAAGYAVRDGHRAPR